MFGGPNVNYTDQNRNPEWERMAAMNAPRFTGTRDEGLALQGKPAGWSYTGSIASDLDAYYGQDVSGRGGNYSTTGDRFRPGGSSSGNTSIGGVSAVNPQAGQANELDAFRRYEDAAYTNAMSRLEPQFDRQLQQFNQQMANQGIPVGSEAYDTAYRNMMQGQAGASSNAAFDAMGFGLGAQNQSFQQSLARSQLANALLRAQWQKELGLGSLGLGYAQLGEQGRQFDQNLGYNYDTFYDTLGQRNYEFDANQDYNYWDRGNYWDFAYDRANASDYFDSWDRDYGSQQEFMDLVLSLFGQTPGSAGLKAPYNPQPGSPYDWSWMF